jgi:radical SAM family uncharacterized protein
MLDDFLLQVQKPGRYIGGEWNACRKDLKEAAVTFALGFPDLYEVGMSNLGLRIIYGLLNSLPQVKCERFFSPDADMEGQLRSRNLPLFTLESGAGLGEFDFVGFSLGFELCYTNVLNALELGGIPLKASQRGKGHPLVIGGGPCVLNPEPVADFFDLFVIGEADEAIVELVDLFRRHKADYQRGKITKDELLVIFSAVEGVYCPGLYQVEYAAEGSLERFRPVHAGVPEKIKKRVVADLNAAFYPLDWVVPYIQIVHDRAALEITRGCPNRCRFCQARQQYYPYREKNAQHILGQAQELIRRTGYEELSLCGLSVTEHSAMEKILATLVGVFLQKGVAVSLPSLKPRDYLGELSALIARIKKTGLTFAPEAALPRMREALGKDFEESVFFQSLEKAYASGYQHVKLYFMIGLPGEGAEDLDAMVDFCRRVSELRRRAAGHPAQVNVSVNALIPKPHTCFQWLAMEGLEAVKSRQGYLKARAKNRRLAFSFHSPEMSFLEGVICRGDRRLSQAIYQAFKRGARFDAWGNHFNLGRWLEAFRESGIDPQAYLRAKSPEAALPWGFIDVGVKGDFLRGEFNKLIEIQEDKRYNGTKFLAPQKQEEPNAQEDQ